MKASKTIQRPANWQDFETLCKRLWGELWLCPNEIKKNGRSGQAQHGVDVYGCPVDDSNSYYGIQCKGKDEYKSTPFTQAEILREIEKAKAFSPRLKKLYFATTAQKDVAIETFIREKNIEHKQSDLFEVHLFCWEDIVDLIDQTRDTKAWYLNSQDYKSNKSAIVTFQDGSTEMTSEPLFMQKVTRYALKDDSDSVIPGLENYSRMIALVNAAMPKPVLASRKSLSYTPIKIKITNTGSDPIENYKLFFEIEGKIQKLAKTNVVEDYSISLPGLAIPTTRLDLEKMSGSLVAPHLNPMLVSDDSHSSSEFFIKPFPQEKSTIEIKWKLTSKDYKDEGKLLLNLNPTIERDYKRIIVEDPSDVKKEIGDIEDFLEDVKRGE